MELDEEGGERNSRSTSSAAFEPAMRLNMGIGVDGFSNNSVACCIASQIFNPLSDCSGRSSHEPRIR